MDKVSEPMEKINAPSPLRVIWRELYNDKLALFCLFLFIVIVGTAFIGAAIIDAGETLNQNLSISNNPPGDGFLLGTDIAGRPILQMLIIGARNSLIISILVAFFASVIGIVFGLVAGFYGGKVDDILMRILDFLTIIPTLMFTIVMIVLLEGTVLNFGLVLVAFAWLGTARFMRMMTLQQGAMDYVKASKTLGTRNIVIIFREVVPNIVPAMTMMLTLTVASTMGIETGLTIIGFGLPPDTPTLGIMISRALNPLAMTSRPWQWAPAALLILAMVLCINYVGQAIGRASDARRRRV